MKFATIGAMLSEQQILSFQSKILDWYAVNQRDFPWRKTRDPYAIFISEVMSQQTQINRVLAKYQEWLQSFPTVTALARASNVDVLRLWSGLGYNRRALNLKKAAEIIAQQYEGNFPRSEHLLLSLPGVGPYTARAILCFAFDEQIAVVDTNVRKVILVEFPEINDVPKAIEMAAAQLLPQGHAYEWNQALMDYSSSVLKKEKIPIPKQSTFIGSHRYYRGQVLKQLLHKEHIAVAEIGGLIKKDFSSEDEPWLHALLEELTTEGFILRDNDEILLPS